MLIPSIDLQGGKIVQLVQGERLAIETDEVDKWIQKFARYPKIQLIDLDAAKGSGANTALVSRICRALPCRVGGGIRSIARAHEVIALGARKLILGSSLFRGSGVDVDFAREMSDAIGAERLIAAIDAKAGKVVIHGWRTALDIRPSEALTVLEPFVSEFLYTHVDLEGLMQGTDIDAIRALRRSTTRALTAAGGITTQAEIDELDAIHVDAVVGMALYTGKLKV